MKGSERAAELPGDHDSPKLGATTRGQIRDTLD